MPHFTDAEGGRPIIQYGTDDRRIRQGSPLHYSGEDGVRPFDLSRDNSATAVAERKESHPDGSRLLEAVIVDVDDDGNRTISQYKGQESASGPTKVFVEDRMIPIVPVGHGDTVHLRSITEQFEGRTADETPRFREFDRVSLVEDPYAVDGVRLAKPSGIVDAVTSVEIGAVGGLPHRKSERTGYSTDVPVVLS